VFVGVLQTHIQFDVAVVGSVVVVTVVVLVLVVVEVDVVEFVGAVLIVVVFGSMIWAGFNRFCLL
jgi:hypothetical protein